MHLHKLKSSAKKDSFFKAIDAAKETPTKTQQTLENIAIKAQLLLNVVFGQGGESELLPVPSSCAPHLRPVRDLQLGCCRLG